MERIRARIDEIYGLHRFRNLRGHLSSLFPDAIAYTVDHMMTLCLAIYKEDGPLLKLWKERDREYYYQSSSDKREVRRLYAAFISMCNNPILDAGYISGKVLQAGMDRRNGSDTRGRMVLVSASVRKLE